jgi:hypothetical protein
MVTKNGAHYDYLGWPGDGPAVKAVDRPMASVGINAICDRVWALDNQLVDLTRESDEALKWSSRRERLEAFGVLSKSRANITAAEEEFLLKFERKLLDWGDARWKRDYTDPTSFPALRFVWREPRTPQETSEITNKTSNSKKEQKKMASSKIVTLPDAANLTAELKTAAEAAMWRTAAEKAVRLVRDVMVARLDGQNDPRHAAVADFLATPEGTAVLGAVLGIAPLFSPALAADPRVARLTAEMRVDSVKFVTDLLAEHVLLPVTEAFTAALAGVPQDGEK